MSAEKPRRLGKGLEALIASASSGSPSVPASDLQRIPVARVRANPFQPRRHFDPSELAELESSLKASGLLQPITVRRKGDAYELIAGERRFRAASNLGWAEIPAIVRDFDDQTMLVLALVENLQRANLNAIEEARGYRRLVDEFQLTQQEVADAVGKDRTTVTNLLRLLSLPAPLQAMVEEGLLSGGHAKALLSVEIDSAVELAKESASGGLSVRELERRVRELMERRSSTGSAQPAKTRPAVTPPSSSAPSSAAKEIEDQLRRHLQTDVRLHVSPDNKGKIEVSFYSVDDLERILDLLVPRRADF